MEERAAIDIRGFAALSCFGSDIAEHAKLVRQGRTGLVAGAASALGDAALPAAVISDEEFSPERPLHLSDRGVDLLVANLDLTAAERRECALLVGTTTGLTASEECAYLRDKAMGKPWSGRMVTGGPGRLAAHVADRLGARGPVFTYATACTSTAVAAVTAARMIRTGAIRRAVVFGLDVIMKVSLDGFRMLKLYSTTACRPFDRDRDGLQFGEGVAALVLERRDGRRRSRFELLDGAIGHDPGHIAAGSNDGATPAAVMSAALKRSGIAPTEVTAVKAHGTGTTSNDQNELRGMATVFGSRVPPFASLKGVFGHTMGASAALETAVWLSCLEHGFAPASVGFANPGDPSDPVPATRPLDLGGRPGVHLFNSFGFGGTCASYVVLDHRES